MALPQKTGRGNEEGRARERGGGETLDSQSKDKPPDNLPQPTRFSEADHQLCRQ